MGKTNSVIIVIINLPRATDVAYMMLAKDAHKSRKSIKSADGAILQALYTPWACRAARVTQAKFNRVLLSCICVLMCLPKAVGTFDHYPE